jgi:hypothetical protein
MSKRARSKNSNNSSKKLKTKSPKENTEELFSFLREEQFSKAADLLKHLTKEDLVLDLVDEDRNDTLLSYVLRSCVHYTWDESHRYRVAFRYISTPSKKKIIAGLKVAKKLIKIDTDHIMTGLPNEDGWTPLYMLCWIGSAETEELAEELVDTGHANVNQITADSSIILDRSIDSGFMKLSIKLIDLMENIDIVPEELHEAPFTVFLDRDFKRERFTTDGENLLKKFLLYYYEKNPLSMIFHRGADKICETPYLKKLVKNFVVNDPQFSGFAVEDFCSNRMVSATAQLQNPNVSRAMVVPYVNSTDEILRHLPDTTASIRRVTVPIETGSYSSLSKRSRNNQPPTARNIPFASSSDIIEDRNLMFRDRYEDTSVIVDPQVQGYSITGLKDPNDYEYRTALLPAPKRRKKKKIYNTKKEVVGEMDDEYESDDEEDNNGSTLGWRMLGGRKKRNRTKKSRK